jgi:tetratricopeptide (TPR) repeat protein
LFVENKNRRLLPRWREFLTTVSLGELNGLPRADSLREEWRRSLAEKQSDWIQNPTPWHAADFVAASFVLGQSEGSAEAARDLLTARNLPVPLMQLARKIVQGHVDQLVIPEIDLLEGPALYREIHRLKLRTIQEPRNAIVWVDLARAYTLAGQRELARRGMKVACGISPDNRFVLRSAARLLVHQGDVLEAHRLLTQSAATGRDPWLMAAEIGVASSAGIGSVFARPAKGVIGSGNHPPLSLTELSAALASVELESGKVTKARKLFRESLECPTENSLAQAEWASEQIPGLQVNVDDFKVPRRFEAEAWQSLSGGDWHRAFDSALCWLQDQPFSSRPALLASYLSSTLFQDYERSVRLLTTALVKNPRHPGLTNNLAFALANLGKLEEAQSRISSLELSDLGDTSDITLLATQGLVMFRRDHASEGRRLYEDAISKARQRGLQKYISLATIYLAREEVLLNSDGKVEALHRAIDEAKRCRDKDVLFLLARLVEQVEHVGLSAGGPP